MLSAPALPCRMIDSAVPPFASETKVIRQRLRCADGRTRCGGKAVDEYRQRQAWRSRVELGKAGTSNRGRRVVPAPANVRPNRGKARPIPQHPYQLGQRSRVKKIITCQACDGDVTGCQCVLDVVRLISAGIQGTTAVIRMSAIEVETLNKRGRSS